MLKLPLPKDLTEALARPDAEFWREAAEKELKSFDALGVMMHDCTPEQLSEMGLDKISAVPLRWVWDIKFSPDFTP